MSVCARLGWHSIGGSHMSTQIDQLLFHSDKSESGSSTSIGGSLQDLANVELHHFREAMDSYTSKMTLPSIFPQSLGFERSHKQEEVHAHTGTTDASKEAAKNLYGEFKDKPLSAVTPDACVQPYGIGNCYFVAALASLAKANPQSIMDMIQTNDDGTYTVKFPGASNAVTVDKPSAAEIEQDGGANKYGVWSLVMQKAYGKYCGGGKNDLDGSDGGSAFSAGVRILSEKGVANAGIGYMLPVMSWNSMNSELKDALCPGNPKDALPVTVSTSKSLFSDKTADGFVRGHVYSVLDYKPNPDDIKQSLVTVRNPWGGTDAVRQITLQQFSDNFLQLSIAKR